MHRYAETATQHGQLCRTRAGEAHYTLRDLFASGGDLGRVEWQTTGDEPLAKGLLVVHRVELVRHTKDGAQRVRPSAFFRHVPELAVATAFHDYDATPLARELAEQTKSELAEHVNSSLDIFFAPGAPLAVSEPPSLRRMHCPYNNTSAGLLAGSTYGGASRPTPPLTRVADTR